MKYLETPRVTELHQDFQIKSDGIYFNNQLITGLRVASYQETIDGPLMFKLALKLAYFNRFKCIVDSETLEKLTPVFYDLLRTYNYTPYPTSSAELEEFEELKEEIRDTNTFIPGLQISFIILPGYSHTHIHLSTYNKVFKLPMYKLTSVLLLVQLYNLRFYNALPNVIYC